MCFGFPDWGVALAFFLSIASACLCVVYGCLNWNKGDEPARPEDISWAREQNEQVEKTVTPQ